MAKQFNDASITQKTTPESDYRILGTQPNGKVYYTSWSVFEGLVEALAVGALPAALESIAGLTTSANQMLYTTGANTYATTSLTAFARQILDDADAGAVRSTLGLSANGSSLVTAADYAAMRALLDLESGTDFLSPAAIAAAYAPISHTHAAADVTSGTFADARIPNLAASKITSGTFANARISQASVTQHQAALSIAYSQLTSVPLGLANGIAPLNSSAKIDETYLPDSILGQVEYQGAWNAATNSPAIPAASSANKGHYYISTSDVAAGHGYANVPNVDFKTGDWIISDGSAWTKVDNTDAVSTVFGRSGAVVANESDYQAYYPRLSQTYSNPSWITSLAWGKITSTPTTLAGYGITDAQASDADLTALAGLNGTGFAVRTASNTWAQRTIQPTTGEISVTNGNGVSGDPTISLPSALTFTGKTVTGGTFITPNFTGTSFSTSASSITGIKIDNSGITSGSGVYGVGIEFTRLNSSTSKKAAIVPRQDGADEDQLGLAFFVSGSATAGNPVMEALSINGLNGSVSLSGNLFVDASRNITAGTISSTSGTFSSTLAQTGTGELGITAYNASLGSGAAKGLAFGLSSSTDQSGVIRYNHYTTAAQRYVGIGLAGNLDLLRVFQTGDVTVSGKVTATNIKETIIIAVSDEVSDLTTGTAKVTFRMPFAMTLEGVSASVNTAPTGATIIVDINEAGSTILSTKLSIDASEKTSVTAATAPVISDSALAADAEMTIDIDQVGSTIAGKGLKVVLTGVRA